MGVPPTLRAGAAVPRSRAFANVHPSGGGPLANAKGYAHEQDFSLGPDHLGITRFGTDSKDDVSFSLVTSKPVIKGGQVQKDDNGYTETYDEFDLPRALTALASRSPITRRRATS